MMVDKKHGIVSAIAALIVILLIAGIVTLPVPWWTLAAPAIVFTMFQVIAFDRTGRIVRTSLRDTVFAVGDGLYYLGIGTVLGLGSLILDNSSAISDRLDSNHRSAEVRQLTAARAEVSRLTVEIEKGEKAEKRAQEKVADAGRQVARITPEEYTACEVARQVMKMNESIDGSAASMGSDIPEVWSAVPAECSGIDAAFFTERYANAEAKGVTSDLVRLRRDLASAGEVLTAAQAAVDDDTKKVWFFENLSDASRNLILFEIFPCLLLVGIAIKLGKTSQSLLK